MHVGRLFAAGFTGSEPHYVHTLPFEISDHVVIRVHIRLFPIQGLRIRNNSCRINVNLTFFFGLNSLLSSFHLKPEPRIRDADEDCPVLSSKVYFCQKYMEYRCILLKWLVTQLLLIAFMLLSFSSSVREIKQEINHFLGRFPLRSFNSCHKVFPTDSYCFQSVNICQY